MTTLYESAASAAGTHALVIGVGNYPHLIDGSGPLANKPLGLGQLTSPPVSAAALAKWFLGPLMGQAGPGFTNQAAPLASLEALISATPPGRIATPNGEKEVEPATIQNIQNAFDGWFKRLTSNDANVGVFYFCGHGVMVDTHYLLAEDFGKSAMRPWEATFDVTLTCRAVQREVKGAVYFLIDACRETSRDIALTLGGAPPALKPVDLTKKSNEPGTAIIWAAGEGKLAFADKKDAVSRFTDALLTALSGYCGVKVAGNANWSVDGEVLATAVRRLLEITQQDSDRRQVTEQWISGPSVPLLRLAGVPKVKVSLDMKPEARRAGTSLYLRAVAGGRKTLLHDASAGALKTEVARGFYDVGACESATGNSLRDCLDEELQAPCYLYCIEVQP